MTATTLDSAHHDALLADISTTGKATADVIGPFTGTVLHTIPLSSVGDVEDATAAARAAQLAWYAAGPAHRRAVLLRAHDLLIERREGILDLIQTENGKTRGNAFEEIFAGASAARYYALSARKLMRTRGRRSGLPFVVTTKVAYQPKGVIGVITPWNFPVTLGLLDIVPALAAGNGVVQKADNQTVLTILSTRRAFIDAGVPAALWAVVTGPGGEIGSAVIDNTDHVAFTGSTATGIQVAERAAGRLIGASLELGGKNPMIVLDDVDVAKAASSIVYGCFAGLGQVCVSVERIYVQRAVLDAFTVAFVAKVKALKAGSDLDYSNDIGSLTNAAQFDRVKAHVDDAVKKGATVLTGGGVRSDLGPYFFEPTVLTGVTSAMECYAAETFGPLVALEVFDTEDEAVALANDSQFGLNASVFSSSRSRANRIADRLNAGSVNINEGYRASWATIDAPQGGMKHSGLGHRNGAEGLLRYVESKTISRTTGLLALPSTGRQFEKLSGTMLLVLRSLKALRRR